MSEEGIKSGTRCECQEIHGPHFSSRFVNGPPLKRCPNDATRMAVVEYGYRPFQDLKKPMCGPCAEYAERRAMEAHEGTGSDNA